MLTNVDSSIVAQVKRIADAVDALTPKAELLFHELRELSRDVVGVTRPSYGAAETKAIALLSDAAKQFGFAPSQDAAGNFIVRLPGHTSSGEGVVTGSHLDSVPRGGNYDGAAGAIAGLLAAAALARAAPRCRETLTLIGTRGEESAWFSIHHIGARAALGILGPRELEEARRFDTGRTLAAHMIDEGADVPALKAGARTFDPTKIKAFIELHIEQGPVLVHEKIPVGIVSGIRGNVRVRHGRCIGEYAHSGAVPRLMRQDTFLAVADLAMRCETEWRSVEDAGGDLVLTFGKAYTDPDNHSHNKVPGDFRFSVDIRSHELHTLDGIESFLRRAASDISKERGVKLELGTISRVQPATMAPKIKALMREGAEILGIHALDIASGGGHDAGDFANLGVPAGMIFVRNPNGSHNPDEDMAMPDFIAATKLLAWTIWRMAA